MYVTWKEHTIKTDLLNFKIMLPFPKLDIVEARLEPNGSIFSGDIISDIQLGTFLLLLSNFSELKITE